MTISQREARRLQKRVAALSQEEERRRYVWASDWPNGTEITRAKWPTDDSIPVAIRTARKLKHAVVCVEDSDGLVRFIACPLARKDPT